MIDKEYSLEEITVLLLWTLGIFLIGLGFGVSL
jgi:hypothetical protein